MEPVNYRSNTPQKICPSRRTIISIARLQINKELRRNECIPIFPRTREPRSVFPAKGGIMLVSTPLSLDRASEHTEPRLALAFSERVRAGRAVRRDFSRDNYYGDDNSVVIRGAEARALRRSAKQTSFDGEVSSTGPRKTKPSVGCIN